MKTKPKSGIQFDSCVYIAVMLQSSTTVKTGRGTYAYNVHEILTLKTKHKWCTQMQKSFGKYYCYCQSKTIKTSKEKTAVDLSELPPEVWLLRLLCLTPEKDGGNVHANGLLLASSQPKEQLWPFFPLRTCKVFLFCLTMTSTHQAAVNSGDCRGLGLEVSRSMVFPLEHLWAAFCLIHMNHTCISCC